MTCPFSEKALGVNDWDVGHTFFPTIDKSFENSSSTTRVEFTVYRCACGKSHSKQSSGDIPR